MDYSRSTDSLDLVHWVDTSLIQRQHPVDHYTTCIHTWDTPWFKYLCSDDLRWEYGGLPWPDNRSHQRAENVGKCWKMLESVGKGVHPSVDYEQKKKKTVDNQAFRSWNVFSSNQKSIKCCTCCTHLLHSLAALWTLATLTTLYYCRLGTRVLRVLSALATLVLLVINNAI